MPVVLVEEREPLGHPRVEARGRVAGNLAHDVPPVLEPGELAAGRRGEDRGLAIFAPVAESSYGFATVSESSPSVV